jgi:hypothetical protein
MPYLFFIVLLLMPYLFFVFLLLVPIATIIGLIYAYKKLSRLKFLCLIAVLIAVPFIGFKIYERNFVLSVVPDALGVNSISYEKEELWGFGPGGNEAGIRVYPLPEQISKEIKGRGIEFFNSMPPNQDQSHRDLRGIYDNWAETPIQSFDRRKPNKENKSLNLYDYICVYDFCRDINSEVVAQINSIANSEGSYYAYGRTGLIIVSPSKKIVVYIYKG